MNWTGGRLQRHSKANANTTLKTQRQHFAKARLQQQNGRALQSPMHRPGFIAPFKERQEVDRDVNRAVKSETSAEAPRPLTINDLLSE